MPNPRKVAMLAEITDSLGRATVAVSADYSGLTVAQLTELRRALRPTGAEVKIVKNTLASMAADAVGRPEMKGLLTGPTAIAIGFADPVAPVKALTEHFRTRRMNVTINAGWIDGQIVDRAGVDDIATLPSKEQLIADFAGKIQSPIYNFAGLITASVRNFAGLVDARANQLEGDAA